MSLIASKDLQKIADLLAAQERGEGVIETRRPADSLIWVPLAPCHNLLHPDREFRLVDVSLKPCPHCGAEVELACRPCVRCDGSVYHWYQIKCTNSACVASTFECMQKSRLIAAWNKRVSA